VCTRWTSCLLEESECSRAKRQCCVHTIYSRSSTLEACVHERAGGVHGLSDGHIVQAMPSATRSGAGDSPRRLIANPRHARRGVAGGRKCARAAQERVAAVYAVERASGPTGRLSSSKQNALVTAAARRHTRHSAHSAVQQVDGVCDKLGCAKRTECCLKVVSNWCVVHTRTHMMTIHVTVYAPQPT
jgi:hypothetical protein